MSTMIAEVYEAFIDAGATKEKARAAATAMSEEQLATKGDISKLDQSTKLEISRIENKITLVQWMLGVIIAVEVLPLLKQFL